MVCTVLGGATRRPGTLYVAPCKPLGTDNRACMYEFQYSPATGYALEFGHHYVRFYTNGAQIQVASVPYELASPYSAAGVDPALWEVFQLRVTQINDVIYIAHPNYPPYKLVRLGNSNWTLSIVKFNVPPMMDVNATGIYIGASATIGSGITLSANAGSWSTATFYPAGSAVNQSSTVYVATQDHTSGTFSVDLANGLWVRTKVFDPLQVGGYFQLGYRKDATILTQGITGNLTTGTISVNGNYTVETSETWSADIALQQSNDNGLTWTTITVMSSRSDENFDLPGTVLGPVLMRFVITNWTSVASTVPPRVLLQNSSQILYGVVQIASVANDWAATANVISRLDSTNTTTIWSEGAWSAYRGYPQASCIFQQSLIFGGSVAEPQRVWGSVTDDLGEL